MVKIKNIILVLFIAIVGINPALAGSPGETYIGVQYGLLTYSETGINDVEPTALIGRFGKFSTETFSLEGRIGFGLSDDTVNVLGFDVDLKIDSIIGIYGVGHVDLSDTTSAYGLIGYSRGELTASVLGISVSDNDSDISFGVGIDLSLNDTISFNLEYISYFAKSDFDVSALSFGIINQF